MAHGHVCDPHLSTCDSIRDANLRINVYASGEFSYSLRTYDHFDGPPNSFSVTQWESRGLARPEFACQMHKVHTQAFGQRCGRYTAKGTPNAFHKGSFIQPQRAWFMASETRCAAWCPPQPKRGQLRTAGKSWSRFRSRRVPLPASIRRSISPGGPRGCCRGRFP